MLVAVVTHGAEVIVLTVVAFPTDAKNRLLSTAFANCVLVLDTGRCVVQDAQIIGHGTAVVGSRAVIPDNYHL